MKPSAATPITVIGVLLIVTRVPTMFGAPAKRRCQYAWLSTATGWAPAVRSSSGPINRPSAGWTPMNWK